jgi:hypothetical protein
MWSLDLSNMFKLFFFLSIVAVTQCVVGPTGQWAIHRTDKDVWFTTNSAWTAFTWNAYTDPVDVNGYFWIFVDPLVVSGTAFNTKICKTSSGPCIGKNLGGYYLQSSAIGATVWTIDNSASTTWGYNYASMKDSTCAACTAFAMQFRVPYQLELIAEAQTIDYIPWRNRTKATIGFTTVDYLGWIWWSNTQPYVAEGYISYMMGFSLPAEFRAPTNLQILNSTFGTKPHTTPPPHYTSTSSVCQLNGPVSATGTSYDNRPGCISTSTFPTPNVSPDGVFRYPLGVYSKTNQNVYLQYDVLTQVDLRIWSDTTMPFSHRPKVYII